MGKQIVKKIIRLSVVIFLLLQLIQFSIVNPYDLNVNTLKGGSGDLETWFNESKLYVSLIVDQPQVWRYGLESLEGGSWVDRTNQQITVDNQTKHRFMIQVVSYKGWSNISYINVTSWYDNGTDPSSYNETHGGNYNMRFVYDNTSNTTADISMLWPHHEVRDFNGYEENVTDEFVGDPTFGPTETQEPEYPKETFYNDTVCKKIYFEFIPGCQFRYAPGPATWDDTNSTVNSFIGHEEYLNNEKSWNFNITAITYDSFESSIADEFGVYSYTNIVQAGDPVIIGEPLHYRSTNSSNPYNDKSLNVTIQTVTNGNYSLCVNLSGDLVNIDNPSEVIDGERVYIRGGTRTTPGQFSDGGQDYVFYMGQGMPVEHHLIMLQLK